MNPRTQGPCTWCDDRGHERSGFDGEKWYGPDYGVCRCCNGTKIIECGEVQWDEEHCNGNVEIRDGAYCEFHARQRSDRKIAAYERARPYLGDIPPDWFDPTYAGEHWDDDY